MTPFNKPFLTGKETEYITDAVFSGKISGNGKYTQKCQKFFETKFGFKKALLTTSCTDALEMAAILINIKEGDEVIMPSYTFVSTANAFVLRGAKIIFALICYALIYQVFDLKFEFELENLFVVAQLYFSIEQFLFLAQ